MNSFAHLKGSAGRAALLAGAGLLVLSRAPLAAADAGQELAGQSQDSGELSEIVVTAQFKRENLQDTPLAITAFDAASIAARGLTNLADAANDTPGVFIAPAANGFGQSASVSIRGVGQNNPSIALEPGVGIYIDDVYYGMLSGSIFELLDADRVEILRGPQGTLEGKNSIGGAIKLFGKAPGKDPDAYVEVGYGNFNHLVARGATNVTLIDDTLYARVSAGTIRQDGYLKELDYSCATGQTPNLGPGLSASKRTLVDCQTGEEGGKDIVTARGALRWIVNDRIEDQLIGDITQDHSENPAAKLLSQSPLWAGTANFVTGPRSYTNYETNLSRPATANPAENQPYAMPTTSPLDASGIANTLDAQLTDTLHLKSITAYRNEKTVFSQANDASPASIIDQIWSQETRQLTQEIRLLGTIGKFADWTVGGFHYNAAGFSTGRIDIPGGLELGGGGVGLDFLLDDPVRTRSDSGFAHVVIHTTDKLDVTVAGRYTKDRKAFTFNRLGIDGLPYLPLIELSDVTGVYAGSRFDYRAAVNYRWTEDFMTYVEVSTGYKGGGINPSPYYASQVVKFNPETLRTYEAGFKSEFFDRRARVNLALYDSKYNGIQLQVRRCDAFSPYPGAPCSLTTNVGDADVKGVELETQLRPIKALSIDTSVGYVNFAYTHTDPLSGVTVEMQNVYAPKFTVASGVQYTADLPNGASLAPRIDYNYRSQIFTQAVNALSNRIGSVGLMNARLMWKDAKREWEAAAAVTNVLGKFYYVSGNDFHLAPYFVNEDTVGPPREFLVTVKRSF